MRKRNQKFKKFKKFFKFKKLKKLGKIKRKPKKNIYKYKINVNKRWGRVSCVGKSLKVLIYF